MHTLDYLFLILAWPQSDAYRKTFGSDNYKDHAISFGLDIGLTQRDLDAVLNTEITTISDYKSAIAGLACMKYERNDHAHELWGVVDAISGAHRALC